MCNSMTVIVKNAPNAQYICLKATVGIAVLSCTEMEIALNTKSSFQVEQAYAL